MITLYGRCTTNKITLKSALEACASAISEGIAIIYSPTSCQFAKVDDNGDLKDANDKKIKLDGVFELRAFNANYELRWLNEFNGEGTAVLISEHPISNYLQQEISDLSALDIINQKYILWGEGVKSISTSGWGKVATARIGSIDVPVGDLTANKRVCLHTVEYLQADEHGNVSVVEERLTGLKVK